MKTMDDRWSDVHDACEDAVAITWDECHKIYLLMDDEQVDIMKGYGYDITFVTDEQTAFDTLSGWYDESCGLRFIEAIRTEPDPIKGFTSLIEQFADEDEQEW